MFYNSPKEVVLIPRSIWALGNSHENRRKRSIEAGALLAKKLLALSLPV